ncbi:hypothetical protein BH09PLA1_BH09PLA1_02300 [soil metagenome]
MNAITPQLLPPSRSAITIRRSTMDDLPALDALQKQFNRALGFFPRAQMEGYIENGWVLVAQDAATNALRGYCASRDRYLKRDELGVIYQLCVAPGVQRGLVGASLVKEVFAKSAYGCRLYCCWCAKDLEANHFWEAMGFVPIAFRAGSAKKSRVHIFWQKRIVEGDVETKWWYPSQTNQGAIREDRLVFPIPPGTHWTEVEAIAVPRCESPKLEDKSAKSKRSKFAKGPLPPTTRGVRFGRPGAIVAAVEQTEPQAKSKPKRERAPKVKVDPKLATAARELRDRWMEKVNDEPSLLSSVGKYDVTRYLEAPSTPTTTDGTTPLLEAA